GTESMATTSHRTDLPRPRSAHTFVKAEVSVVLPWSTCPIVPMFTCGLRRSYFAFAITSPLRAAFTPPDGARRYRRDRWSPARGLSAGSRKLNSLSDRLVA